MARALREDHFIDANGRSVRRHHAVKAPAVEIGGKMVQQTLWDDIRTAPRKHMEAAFALRRQQIVGDCKQLKNDGDYFNENRTRERPIVLLFDFTPDLEALEVVEELEAGSPA